MNYRQKQTEQAARRQAGKLVEDFRRKHFNRGFIRGAVCAAIVCACVLALRLAVMR